MAGVGGAHPAGALVAVERQHVGAELLVPEGLVEAVAQLGGAAVHRGHLLVAALEAAGDRGGGAPGGVGVGLHLDQRDRAAGERAVGVEDRVVAVLPALVDQAVGVLPAVLDEAVAVAVAVDLDPGQRRLDVGPELEHGGEIAGAVEVGAGQHDEERRRVDAAVVAAERHLPELGHLAEAHLVQDLAGLGVGGGVDLGRLGGGEVAQHAAGDLRVEPERLQRGDQRVAAEDGGEPGDAGIGIGAVLGRR